MPTSLLYYFIHFRYIWKQILLTHARGFRVLGIGQATWNLTQQAAFVVVDRKGLVVDVILGAPSKADFERSFQVLRNLIASE